jgi:gentisate 1,2-dioxygenase
MNPDIEKLRRLVAAQVAPQASEVRPLLIAYQEIQDKLKRIQAFVNQQAEEEGLWFEAETAPEAYLQEALRELYRVIED